MCRKLLKTVLDKLKKRRILGNKTIRWNIDTGAETVRYKDSNRDREIPNEYFASI